MAGGAVHIMSTGGAAELSQLMTYCTCCFFKFSYNYKAVSPLQKSNRAETANTTLQAEQSFGCHFRFNYASFIPDILFIHDTSGNRVHFSHSEMISIL